MMNQVVKILIKTIKQYRKRKQKSWRVCGGIRKKKIDDLKSKSSPGEPINRVNLF